MVQTSSHYKSCGSFTGSLSHNNMETAEEIFVIQGLLPLVGRLSISALKLVARVPLIQADRETVAKQFPELFKGLGQMTGKYHIKLQSNVTSQLLDAYPYL